MLINLLYHTLSVLELVNSVLQLLIENDAVGNHDDAVKDALSGAMELRQPEIAALKGDSPGLLRPCPVCQGPIGVSTTLRPSSIPVPP